MLVSIRGKREEEYNDMISCTEFIAAYSELFGFLEETYGADEVGRFWEYLFQPDGKGMLG